MKDSERSRFYAQLARVLDSGLAPVQALSMLGEKGAALATSLAGGSPLSRALRRDPDFAELETWVVEAGEASGNLSSCLESLSQFFERRNRVKKRILGKLLYPAILLHAVFLLPPLGLFLTEGPAAYLRVAVLPLIAIWSLLAVGTFILGRLRSAPGTAPWIDRLSLRLPMLGSCMRDRALALYAAALALLLRAGLPMVDSLERAARVVPNHSLRLQAMAFGGEVRRGRGLAESMTGVFPANLVEMVRVGEVTGRLDGQLEVAAGFLDQEAQTKLTRLVTLSSFLAFFLVAILVGAVVVKSWLAIVGLF